MLVEKIVMYIADFFGAVDQHFSIFNISDFSICNYKIVKNQFWTVAENVSFFKKSGVHWRFFRYNEWYTFEKKSRTLGAQGRVVFQIDFFKVDLMYETGVSIAYKTGLIVFFIIAFQPLFRLVNIDRHIDQ